MKIKGNKEREVRNTLYTPTFVSSREWNKLSILSCRLVHNCPLIACRLKALSTLATVQVLLSSSQRIRSASSPVMGADVIKPPKHRFLYSIVGNSRNILAITSYSKISTLWIMTLDIVTTKFGSTNPTYLAGFAVWTGNISMLMLLRCDGLHWEASSPCIRVNSHTPTPKRGYMEVSLYVIIKGLKSFN